MTESDFKINNLDVIKTKNTHGLNTVISQIIGGLGKLVGEDKLPNTVQTIFHYDFDGRKYDVYKDVGHNSIRGAKIFGINGNNIDIKNFVSGGISELTAEQIVEFRNFLGLDGVALAEELSLTARISLLEKQNKILEARLEKLEHAASLNKTLEERVAKLEIEVWGVKK